VQQIAPAQSLDVVHAFGHDVPHNPLQQSSPAWTLQSMDCVHRCGQATWPVSTHSPATASPTSTRGSDVQHVSPCDVSHAELAAQLLGHIFGSRHIFCA
jgi:hypothetical protein